MVEGTAGEEVGTVGETGTEVVTVGTGAAVAEVTTGVGALVVRDRHSDTTFPAAVAASASTTGIAAWI